MRRSEKTLFASTSRASCPEISLTTSARRSGLLTAFREPPVELFLLEDLHAQVSELEVHLMKRCVVPRAVDEVRSLVRLGVVGDDHTLSGVLSLSMTHLLALRYPSRSRALAGGFTCVGAHSPALCALLDSSSTCGSVEKDLWGSVHTPGSAHTDGRPRPLLVPERQHPAVVRVARRRRSGSRKKSAASRRITGESAISAMRLGIA